MANQEEVLEWQRREWAPLAGIADNIISLPDLLRDILSHGQSSIPANNPFLNQVFVSPSVNLALAIRLDQFCHCFLDGNIEDHYFRDVLQFLSYFFDGYKMALGGWQAVCSLLGTFDWFPSQYVQIFRTYPEGLKLLPTTTALSNVVVEDDDDMVSSDRMISSDRAGIRNPSDVLSESAKGGSSDMMSSHAGISNPSNVLSAKAVRYCRNTNDETLEIEAPTLQEATELMQAEHKCRHEHLQQEHKCRHEHLQQERSNDDNRHHHKMEQMEKQSSLRQEELKLQIELEQAKNQIQVNMSNQAQAVTPAPPRKRKAVIDTPRATRKTPAKTPRTRVTSRKLAIKLKRIILPTGDNNYQTIDALEGDVDFDYSQFQNRLVPSCPAGLALTLLRKSRVKVDGAGVCQFDDLYCRCISNRSESLTLRCVRVPLENTGRFIYVLQRPETKPNCHVEGGPVKGVDEDIFEEYRPKPNYKA